MVMVISIPQYSYSQKKDKPENKITAADLESYVSFLASPLLKGRRNGDVGLEIAGQFIALQAKLSGLKPANGNSYFQPYSVIEKSIDREKTSVQVISGVKDTVTLKDPIYQLIPTGPSDYMIEGELVFAGYGIKSDKYKYNDFANLNTEGKVLLIMDRAPMSGDGKKCQFEEHGWSTDMNVQMKLTTLMLTKAKAVLIVPDPKSGFQSPEESSPELTGFLKTKITLNGTKDELINPFMAALPKMIYIPHSVANEILKGSGHSLEELQKSIDSALQPHSFAIENKHFKIREVTLKTEETLNNVAGYIEGGDPVLKNEIVIFSSHYDHIGVSGDKVNTGADDNASGCAALLSIAEAFGRLKDKPKRSILFLWVSGEEIGLYGSKSYVNNPLFPLEKTVADLNMDMIGRIKEAADSTKDTPMTDRNSVFVITDNQSRELMAIADDVDKKSTIDFNYSLSGRDHPLQLFSRSDHYNFVQNNIPVLFFTTGLHTDYHTPNDVVSKIDFEKMEVISKAMFEIGLTVANRKTRLVVDNPYHK